MYSVDDINEILLNNMSDDYEKTAGFPTADFLRAFAIGLKGAYDKIYDVEERFNVDNLSDTELSRFVKQRKGTLRKEAKKAIGILAVTGNGTINVGDLFETESGIQFMAKNDSAISGSGLIEIEAVLAGNIGVVGANSIKLMPVTIQGIVSVNNPKATYDGYDEETDDSLRDRYYLALRKPPTSGNKYHYMLWAKEVVGVSEAEVIGLWNGDNTVKVIIIDDNKQPANSELVERTQNYIDPKGEFIDGKWTLWGTGSGQAPMGAYCTVVSATGLNINITANVVLLDGYSQEDVLEKIKTNIQKYLKDIAFKQSYVSYAKIANELNDTEGVFDYAELKVNGAMSNIAVGREQVAILGSVVITFEHR